MLTDLATLRYVLVPDPVRLVLVFFVFSTLGYIMECIVLTIDKKELVLNRGFASHLPCCIIYGFGALLGYTLLSPFKNNLLLLFIFGALSASLFEYVVARLQIRLFEDFWWDYSEKPFNYKGILCLESTLGWGIVSIVIVKVLYQLVYHSVSRIPQPLQQPLAMILILSYFADFFVSARIARQKKFEQQEIKPFYIDDFRD